MKTSHPKVDPRWIRNKSDELAIEQGCYFDEDAGQFVIDFIETFCKQAKGRQWAGKPLTLLDWQKDFLMRLFGWKQASGLRRFTRVYLEVAKKNGKSTIVSALALYFLLADGEGGPEIYLNAVDREQASIIYDEACRMIRASDAFSRRVQIIESKKRVIDPEGNGKIVANSADVPSKDGINSSATIFDELHRQKTRDMWDIFEYAGEAREEPITISITTAGEAEEGVWYEQREYSEQVNQGVIPDITHLGIVYRVDEKDNLEDPAVWRKANPSLGVTISEEVFARKLAEAKLVPEKWANFKRLRLNLITASAVQYIALDDWDQCDGIPIFPPLCPIYGGLDLSSIDDLTALVWIAGEAEGGWDVKAKFWLPERDIVSLEQKHQVKYRMWAEMGLITLTPGRTIDYAFVRREVNELTEEHKLERLLCDPANATKLAGELREQDGVPIEYIRQGYVSLNPPTKELRRLVLAGLIRHGGNPVLRWNIANAIAVTDPTNSIKLDKKKSRKKIDGAAALVNAIACTLVAEDTTSVYETEELLIL